MVGCASDWGYPSPHRYRIDRNRATTMAYRTLALLLLLIGSSSLTAEEALWEAIASGGHAVLLRHTLAPGVGDPDTFTHGDCSTQRNLSEAGRQQARGIGERFRAAGIRRLSVYSSRWCRALETAELLGLGHVEQHPGLDSFFDERGRRDEVTANLTALIESLRDDASAILVTHQVNVRAVTGYSTVSGEGIVVRADEQGRIQIIGRINPPLAN